jgi:hypothetical protein
MQRPAFISGVPMLKMTIFVEANVPRKDAVIHSQHHEYKVLSVIKTTVQGKPAWLVDAQEIR